MIKNQSKKKEQDKFSYIFEFIFGEISFDEPPQEHHPDDDEREGGCCWAQLANDEKEQTKDLNHRVP